MKKILHRGTINDLIVIESLLEADDIAFSVHNENRLGIPATPLPPEIWIHNDNQYNKAQETIRDYYKRRGRIRKQDTFYWLRLTLGIFFLIALLNMIYTLITTW